MVADCLETLEFWQELVQAHAHKAVAKEVPFCPARIEQPGVDAMGMRTIGLKKFDTIFKTAGALVEQVVACNNALVDEFEARMLNPTGPPVYLLHNPQ